MSSIHVSGLNGYFYFDKHEMCLLKQFVQLAQLSRAEDYLLLFDGEHLHSTMGY